MIKILRSLLARYLLVTFLFLYVLPSYAATLPINPENLAQEIRQGTVRSTDGQPIANATIRVKDANRSTSTDAQGNFQILASGTETLLIQSIGYQSLETPIADRTTLTITLRAAVLQIAEVVTTGYQSIDRRKFTGAATLLKAEDAQRAGIPDVSRMLEGQVAGVSVQNVSGTFGAAPKIRVRGATSITGDNKPLWVVDGIILEDVINISNDQLSTGDASTLLGSSVAGLNADDIESFQILKDAAATSLYGARAMNGVIQITTKKGRVGPTTISYTGNYSTYLKPSYSQFDIVNSYDQMSIFAELYRKGNIDLPNWLNEANSGVYGNLSRAISQWENGRPLVENTVAGRSEFLQRYVDVNTDWFDLLFRNSLMHEHSLAVSTGSEKSQVYYSTSYLNDAGWTLGNTAERFTGNIRGNFKISDKLSFGILTTGSIRNQVSPGTFERTDNTSTGEVTRNFDINPFSYATQTTRTISPFAEDGSLEYVTMNHAPFNILNELENNYMDLRMIDLKVQGELTYKLPKHITYNFIGAYRYVNTQSEHKVYEQSNLPQAYRAGTIYGSTGVENSTIADANRFLYRPIESLDGRPISVLPYGGIYNTNQNLLKSYYLRNSLDWEQTFGKHYFNVIGFQELRFLDRIQSFTNGYGYQFDRGGVVFIDPNAIRVNAESNLPYFGMEVFQDRYVAFASNARYSYAGKYQLSGTLRYDGSNQLGPGASSRWLPTWNISGSWNVDEESFLKDQSWLSNLTIRGTYGLVASLGEATNASLVLRSANVNRLYPSELEPVINIQYLANSDLTWEKQYETNIGVDWGFLNNRYQVTLDVYRRQGFDLIGPIRVSGIGGDEIRIANYADLNSQGVELLLRATVFDSPKWSWKTQLTNAYHNGRITNLLSEPSIWNLVNNVGGSLVGYPARGLFSIDFERLSADRGVPEYVNQDGEVGNNVYLQSTFTDYLKYEGPVDPTFNGGFFNSFRYKNFNFSALISYSAGNKIRLNPLFKNQYSELDAMSYDFLNRFVLPNDYLIPSIADARTASRLDGNQVYNAYNYSTDRVADGGFIRLKQVSAGFNFPERYVKSLKLRSLSLNIVANNLWLIAASSNLNGQDPEFYASGGVALPNPRQFTLSFKASL
ncbi:SusC/RagA family TonB-linked outer membrane protein [Sphingobacteriaceae bacterium WQ 2009]|uniref:SusC/RagA family TonB-linked outer membrane protein n=1 Tax=Rhinopithecimicrobium faecis TaxID=2820698 RepID=A0A8T4H7K7_9SPHI|nr:SusC/RagA family TonB-linked outer membrane protein [Sphingobacteriaceae bacterium WQ 2009]